MPRGVAPRDRRQSQGAADRGQLAGHPAGRSHHGGRHGCPESHPAPARYLTSIAPQDLDANDLAQLYACRWPVVLVFKEFKSHYRFNEPPTRKAPVVEALLASRRLLDAVRGRRRRLRHRIPESRWASLFASAASHILDLILLPARNARALARRLEPMLLHEAVDPNASKLLPLQRVDRGVAWAP